MENENEKYVSREKEILFSRSVKAGKRIYYIDVKRNLKDDLFIAITESKKVLQKNAAEVSFEKHKIFLYKEDFDKFSNALEDVISYIRKVQKSEICLSDLEENKEG